MMPGQGGAAPEWISAAMLAQPWSVQFWGDSRVALNRAAFEVAHRVNPRYVWLEIATPQDLAHPEDPARNGLVPDNMLYRTVPPSDLKPEDAGANLGMWSVVRTDEPEEVLHPLMDFLRLPERLQEVIGNAPREERPAVYVAANADRVVQFYPDDPESSRPILDVFHRERMMIIITFLNLPRKNRFLYDYVFEIRSGQTPDWPDSALICEKAPPGQGYQIGVPIRAFPPR
jgi:hypothetical protein